ncbi:MAG: TetR/AcrR family transcriptional regulator [Clostridia bacterium]|nr:TetR/AcrR family transcriptional regulator [Clostridia bacterium]
MTIKDVKRNFVTDEATALFLERPISAVTIKDIAASSGVGEATVYRYFAGKNELVVASALKLQSAVETKFTAFDAGKNGYQNIYRFFEAYLDTFRENPGHYRFLSEFDAYCVSEGVTGLDEYSDNFDKFKDAFMKSYRDGVADGSVRKIENVELFYYSATHSVLSLCKKLAAEGHMIRQDDLTDKAQEIETLIDVILHYLKA